MLSEQTNITADMLDETAQVLSVAVTQLKRNPDWSVSMMHVLSDRLSRHREWFPVRDFLSTGKITDALELTQHMTALQAKYADALRSARDKLVQSGDKAAALREAQTLASFAEVTADAAIRAHLLAQNGKLADATRTIEKVIQAQPDHAEHHRLLASLFERQGKFPRARDAAAAALALSPQSLDLLADLFRITTKLAAAIRKERDNASTPETSRAAATQLIELRLECASDALTLAYIEAVHGHLDFALDAVDRTLAGGIADAEVFRLKASLLERQGRFSDALEAVRIAAEMNPEIHELGADEMRIRASLRNAFLHERDAAPDQVKAIASAQAMRDAGLEQPEDIAALAHLEVAAGRMTEGLATIDRAIAAAPNVSENHRLRASILERIGRPEDALVAVRIAIRLNPANEDMQRDRKRLTRRCFLQRLSRRLNVIA
ncbi:tetratricopeptide repeat protein [Paraburkholderia strydomiana]